MASVHPNNFIAITAISNLHNNFTANQKLFVFISPILSFNIRKQREMIQLLLYKWASIHSSDILFVLFCRMYTGCPKKKDTVTLSHNFRLNYQNSKLQAGM